ncbi:MAG: hypothetical protein IPO32_20280 [Crocinitomicaceae bacterium]|nr:hypothetical protein [Crocinitomicaceae bacterium]
MWAEMAYNGADAPIGVYTETFTVTVAGSRFIKEGTGHVSSANENV